MSSRTKPLRISVLMVCYNAASVIESTLLSIVQQTYPNIEFVVIDGQSKDTTLAILRRYGGKISILISEPDRGIYDAMNKAVRHATGDAVIFMNAGDYFLSPFAIEAAIDCWRALPEADVAYGGLEIRHENGTTTEFMPPGQDEALEFLIAHSLPHQATFAKRSVFRRTGPFDRTYRSHADYEWFLKVATNPHLRLYRLPLLVASFALGGASSQLERGENERYVIQNKMPLLQTERWLRKRIEIYQGIYLSQRLELESLKAMMEAPR